MNEQKLCKDCKYYKKDWMEHIFCGDDRFDKCCNPVFSINLVTGKNRKVYCDILRGKYGGCGPEARHFEPKNS